MTLKMSPLGVLEFNGRFDPLTGRLRAGPMDRHRAAGVTVEITTVDFTGLDGSDFDGGGAAKSFTIRGNSAKIGVYFTDGAATQPDLSGLGVTSYVQVSSFDALSSASEMATLTANALNASLFAAIADGAVVIITALTAGVRTDAADVNTGAAITVTQQGA
jgi:hypothetical protein